MNTVTRDGLRLNDRVTLHYRIRCLEQEVANTFEAGPETFTLGQGDIDPRLELCLTGLKAGEHRLFQLEPWQAFGERHEELVQTLPRSDFPADMELAVDHMVEFEVPSGEIMQGRILELDADRVRLDFNHPLAGLPVEFEVEILDIAKRDSNVD
ncbi:MAG: FKBP-type peptidyl-prolyl cis-trans isomerase [Betaproteobacteria bacterium]|nr:FKBP-type peptidyl-prolyl cis-trans isomerase [Betaproteobacteria bacterium]